jgi:hypothetical protein
MVIFAGLLIPTSVQFVNLPEPNLQGKYIINPQFDYAEAFRGGIASVVIDNKTGYINKKVSLFGRISNINDNLQFYKNNYTS